MPPRDLGGIFSILLESLSSCLQSYMATTIGTTITINGDVTCDEPLRIDGRVTGNVLLREAELTVGKAAQVDADVRSARVLVHIPVKVGAANGSAGVRFDEDAAIVKLSKNGGCISIGRPVGVGEKLRLFTAGGREFLAGIVWVGDQSTKTDGQVGIQCRGLAQALGVEVVDPGGVEQVGAQVARHDVRLGDAVGNRGGGGECHSSGHFC